MSRSACFLSAEVLSFALVGAPTVQSEEDKAFSILIRVQPEMVQVGGRLAEGRGQDGWHLAHGWGSGSKNSHNWGAVFIDGHHQSGAGLRLFARIGLNVDMRVSRMVMGANARSRPNFPGIGAACALDDSKRARPRRLRGQCPLLADADTCVQRSLPRTDRRSVVARPPHATLQRRPAWQGPSW